MVTGSEKGGIVKTEIVKPEELRSLIVKLTASEQKVEGGEIGRLCPYIVSRPRFYLSVLRHFDTLNPVGRNQDYFVDLAA
jgi:hypothetical protein